MNVILKTYKKISIIIVALFCAQVALGQFTIPKKPKLQTSVYDYANLLTASQKSSLEQKLIRYSDSTSTQIVIATVETINGEDIGILTPKWAHEWGIGQAKEDNGVFILLANKEHKIWIAPGYGVEYKLTAGTTGTIVRNIIIPEFKKGDFYLGLDKGADAIFEVLNGTYKNNQPQKSESSGIPTIVIILIVFFILMIVFSNKRNGGSNNKRFRRNTTASDILEAIILSRAGRGGFGGGSFGGGSSGGFGGGFGGGGFSGGGAGGSW